MALPRVLFHVQHLLGIGHARRAALIAGALAGAGCTVTVADGGWPVPGLAWGTGVRRVQLPPLRAADGNFRNLITADGDPIDDAWRAGRCRATLDLFETTDPDLLLIEGYPFARRALRFELEPLLAAAQARKRRPLIAVSVRDILVGKAEPGWAEETAARVKKHFGRVLVHGDPGLIRFDDSFSAASRLAGLIRYTGYVAAPPAPVSQSPDAAGAVIVSVGGGAVGEALLRTALAARALSPLAEAPWRLLLGPETPRAVQAQLAAAAPPGVTVEPARPDFPALLAGCRLSISQGGYNTILDLLQARCRALVVPFAAGRETEQITRARLLAARGLLTLVEEDGLDPPRLAAGIAAALAAPPPPSLPLALDGAAASARILLADLAARQDDA